MRSVTSRLMTDLVLTSISFSSFCNSLFYSLVVRHSAKSVPVFRVRVAAVGSTRCRSRTHARTIPQHFLSGRRRLCGNGEFSRHWKGHQKASQGIPVRANPGFSYFFIVSFFFFFFFSFFFFFFFFFLFLFLFLLLLLLLLLLLILLLPLQTSS